MSNPKRIKLEVLTPVLADDSIDEAPLTKVYVDSLSHPRDTSKVIVELNSVLPIPELKHLKRVKGKQILLYPVTENEPISTVHEILKTKNFDLSYLKNDVKVVEVAAMAPKTRAQYEIVSRLWPCNFHSDKYLEKLFTNTLFSTEELKTHVLCMQMAIAVAKYSVAQNHSKKCSGVVIMDPKINSVVAVGYSRQYQNPYLHSVMVAIDNVATTQNGGVWSNKVSSVNEIDGNLNVTGIPANFLKHLQNKFPRCKFGARLFKTKEQLECVEDGPYLCTGYYVYSTHEPCITCGMALIHSRANRVFYGAKSTAGSLGSVCKLHTIKELNHHYEVFSGLLEYECQSLQ